MKKFWVTIKITYKFQKSIEADSIRTAVDFSEASNSDEIKKMKEFLKSSIPGVDGDSLFITREVVKIVEAQQGGILNEA